MDTPTFIVELIRELAWPFTVLLIIFLLRKPLSELLPLLQHIRYQGIELDFGRQVQELTVQAAREIPQATHVSEETRRLKAHLEKLALLSPRAVVLESWLLLEEAAVEASQKNKLKLSSRELRSPALLGYYLEQAGIIDENKQEIFNRLRNLRNAAAHASDFAFDSQAAIDYAQTAIDLAEFIQSSKPEKGNT